MSGETKFVIELENIEFSYDKKKPVFTNLELQVTEGDYIFIKGPSGSGKSTLLKLMNRLIEPGKGTIYFQGTPITRMCPLYLRQMVIYVQQVPVMIKGSVKENILFPYKLQVNKNRKPPGLDMIRRKLDEFLLTDISLDDTANKLSVGEQQRISLIRISFLEPLVYLLDEPTSALDHESKKIVNQYFHDINTMKNVTFITVSHFVTIGSENGKSKVYRLANGKLFLES